jgi:tripartite-type tricarboxylate transporter receptor subunit TctC
MIGLCRASSYVLLATSAALVAPAPLSAQLYPTKPVKIIVAFPPGAVTDTTGRLIAARLTATLGQPVIVENKPGASGIIGTEAALKAPPDGYTLTMIASPYTSALVLHKVNFDPIGDITPIIQISQMPFVLIVNPGLPVKNVKELVALARANPGKLNFASAGLGSPSHLATELFSTRAGVRMNHVPYKGGGAVLPDLIAGQTDLFFSPLATALPHVKAGKLRAIAVASLDRSAAAPDIPTVDESGLADYEVVLWFGLAGPKGLPRPIVDRINKEVTMALNTGETGERLRADGSSLAAGTPEQFLAMIKKEIELWREVARKAGVQPE